LSKFLDILSMSVFFSLDKTPKEQHKGGWVPHFVRPLCCSLGVLGFRACAQYILMGYISIYLYVFINN